MYSPVYKSFLNNIYKKKIIKSKIKYLKYRNWKSFYVFLNYHTQQRSGFNITRVYLLNLKLWYFYKTNLINIPKNLCKSTIHLVSLKNFFICLESKIKWFY